MNTFCTATAFIGLKSTLCDNTSVVSSHVEQNFIEHIAAHGISYGTSEEYKFRLAIFAQKDAEYEKINADPSNTFTVGHNHFSTWTDAEYKKLLGFRGQQAPSNVTYLDASNLTDAVDWRTKGAVNAVKNQGQCGSCWTFSAISAFEGHHFIKTGKLESFAEQEIVDCDTTSYGCNGGWQSHAFNYLKAHVAEHETDYPYTARDGTCRYDKSKGTSTVQTYANVPSNSVAQLKAAIAQGPTSVTIEADTYVFQGYTGGILNSKACGTNLDHAVTAVGYGSEGGQDYYIVRNSWGASWGEQGYIRIAAVDGAGICGIQMESLWPTTN